MKLLSLGVVIIFIIVIKPSEQLDCKWSINDGLPSTQALYLNPQEVRRDILGFWLPQYGDVVTVPSEQNVIFACPGGKLNKINKPYANLKCIKDNKFKDENNNEYTFSSLSCSKIPAHTTRRVGKCGGNKNEYCTSKNDCQYKESIVSEDNGPYTLIDIGFQITDNEFYTLMRICFDEENADSLYSVHLQTNHIDGYQEGYPRPNFIEGGLYPSDMDVDDLYSQVSQTEAVEIALKSKQLAEKYIQENTDYFMSRGHLTAKADYVYGSHQKATFYFINVAPQWQTFNGGNWNTLEHNVQVYSSKLNNSQYLHIYTGTHGIMTLPDTNNKQQPIYLHYDSNGKGKLKSPYLFWKILHDPKSGKALGFIAFNNPYENDPGDKFYNMCTNICDKIKWLTWDPNDQKKGYGLCCDANELIKRIPEIPKIYVTGLLL